MGRIRNTIGTGLATLLLASTVPSESNAGGYGAMVSLNMADNVQERTSQTQYDVGYLLLGLTLLGLVAGTSRNHTLDTYSPRKRD